MLVSGAGAITAVTIPEKAFERIPAFYRPGNVRSRVRRSWACRPF